MGDNTGTLQEVTTHETFAEFCYRQRRRVAKTNEVLTRRSTRLRTERVRKGLSEFDVQNMGDCCGMMGPQKPALS